MGGKNIVKVAKKESQKEIIEADLSFENVNKNLNLDRKNMSTWIEVKDMCITESGVVLSC